MLTMRDTPFITRLTYLHTRPMTHIVAHHLTPYNTPISLMDTYDNTPIVNPEPCNPLDISQVEEHV